MAKNSPKEKTQPAPAESEEKPAPAAPREVGGREGPEPTRYGDWEVGGVCTDF